MRPMVDTYYDLYMDDFIPLEDLESCFNTSPTSEDMDFWINLLGGLYEKPCTY